MVQATRKCSIDGCERLAEKRTWCNMHYKRWLRHGDPNYQAAYSKDQPCKVEKCQGKVVGKALCNKHYQRLSRTGSVHPAKRVEKVCSVEDCGQKVVGRGWCSKHWQRWKKSGNPLVTTAFLDPEEAFYNRAKEADDCLVWRGALNPKGYGSIVVNGKAKAAHRYAWERVNGRIPDDMQIDHICHNRSCVNAEHLRLADASENSAHRSGPTTDNASGFRNVYAKGDEWSVQIRKHGKLHSFGAYDTIREAAEVAERERSRLFGKYAGKG